MLAAFTVLLALAIASAAGAASVPSWSFDCNADTTSQASCERLTYIASEQSAIDASLNGDLLSAAVDTRAASYYLLGLVASLIFAYTFWRTFSVATA